MRLARVEIDGEVVNAAIDGDEAILLGPDDQAGLLAIAQAREVGGDHERVPLSAGRLLAPLRRPTSVRDFFAFEEHYVSGRASAGQEPDPEWYERPVFYFTNPAAILGPGDTVHAPQGSRTLDYELEVAAVIGKEASDLDPEDPMTMDVIAGFTIFNDWSARDVQVREMRQNLGPHKGKDFATSIGPWLVTPDQIPFAAWDRPRGRMAATVNGEQWSEGELSDIHFSWAQLLAYASQDTRLVPGDVIGSGTCGTGCILELRTSGMRDTRHWLRPDDRVTLEVEGLGTLPNTVVERPGDR